MLISIVSDLPNSFGRLIDAVEKGRRFGDINFFRFHYFRYCSGRSAGEVYAQYCYIAVQMLYNKGIIRQ